MLALVGIPFRSLISDFFFLFLRCPPIYKMQNLLPNADLPQLPLQLPSNRWLRFHQHMNTPTPFKWELMRESRNYGWYILDSSSNYTYFLQHWNDTRDEWGQGEENQGSAQYRCRCDLRHCSWLYSYCRRQNDPQRCPQPNSQNLWICKPEKRTFQMWLHQGFCKWQTIQDYLSVPNIITRILKSKKGRQEIQKDMIRETEGRMIRLLALKKEAGHKPR